MKCISWVKVGNKPKNNVQESKYLVRYCHLGVSPVNYSDSEMSLLCNPGMFLSKTASALTLDPLVGSLNKFILPCMKAM